MGAGRFLTIQAKCQQQTDGTPGRSVDAAARSQPLDASYDGFTIHEIWAMLQDAGGAMAGWCFSVFGLVRQMSYLSSAVSGLSDQGPKFTACEGIRWQGRLHAKRTFQSPL